MFENGYYMVDNALMPIVYTGWTFCATIDLKDAYLTINVPEETSWY